MSNAIIVVGAGPVGLCLAWALVRTGQSVIVVESREGLARDPRANTLQPTTLDLLDAWGLLEDLGPRGLRADRLTYWDWKARKPIADFEFSLLAEETPFPFRLHVPQWELVELLTQRLEASNLARLEMGWTATGLEQDKKSVRLTVKRRRETATLEGSYLVGADGTHSFVRDALGIDFAYERRPVRFITFEVGNRFLYALAEEAGRRPSNVNILLTEGHWAIVMTMRRSVRVVMPEISDPNRAMAELTSRDVKRHLRDELEIAFEGEIEHRGAYTVHSRIVESMRRGRVFLAGDSAHSTNPVGGTAMNSGIDDAAALALALAKGSERALAAYDTKRLDRIRGVVAEPADHQFRIIGASGTGNAPARNQYLVATAADRDRARAHLMRLSMMEDRLTTPLPVFGDE